ncbi:MAG: DUF4166 domain-containing protein, partial [Sphingomonadales bacterium]
GSAAKRAPIARGRGVAGLIGWVMGFPPNGEYPVHVAFAEHEGRERWTRDFGGHCFSSELSQAGQGVSERFGPLRFVFDLPSDAEGLRMVLRGWTLLGVPMPRWLGPRIEAREWVEDDRFRFDVRVRMPVMGSVVQYAGWLERC